MKNYLIYGPIVGVIVLMLVVLAINMSRGTSLEFDSIPILDQDPLTVTCEQYHGEVISTTYLWTGFLEDCDLTTDLEFDAAYFQDQVIVLYLYDGDASEDPKAFYDYMFTQDGYEIINVRFHWSLASTDESEQSYYLIYIDKDDIVSGDILFN